MPATSNSEQVEEEEGRATENHPYLPGSIVRAYKPATHRGLFNMFSFYA